MPVLDVDMDDGTKRDILATRRADTAASDATEVDAVEHAHKLHQLDIKYNDSLHMPRSLDRAYYEFLDDEVLAKRDQDQVMLRFLNATLENLATKKSPSSPFDGELHFNLEVREPTNRKAPGRVSSLPVLEPRPKDNSHPQILVVRQLWLWKLDDSSAPILV